MIFRGHFHLSINGRNFHFHNDIVDAGINKILDVMFHNDSQLANWYMGLIDNAGFVGLDDSDTMAAHANWAEFTTYSEGSRPAWDENAAAARIMTNTSPANDATFTISTAGNLLGVFMCSDPTKGGTSGILWSTGLLPSAPVPVLIADVIKVRYEVEGDHA